MQCRHAVTGVCAGQSDRGWAGQDCRTTTAIGTQRLRLLLAWTRASASRRGPRHCSRSRDHDVVSTV